MSTSTTPPPISMSDLITCSICGEAHELQASELTFSLPDEIYAFSEQERASRCDISADLCAIDRERFFLRGLLPLPVAGRPRDYRIGVWVEIAEDVLGRIYRLWNDPDQYREPRLPGTLANSLPLQRVESLGLLVAIQLTGPDTRPEFYVRQTGHSLFQEQTQGIDEHRAIEYTDRKQHDAVNR